MKGAVDLCDTQYERVETAVYQAVRAEALGEDLGRTSWIRAALGSPVPLPGSNDGDHDPPERAVGFPIVEGSERPVRGAASLAGALLLVGVVSSCAQRLELVAPERDGPARSYALVCCGPTDHALQESWYWASSTGAVRMLQDLHGYRDEAIHFLHAGAPREARGKPEAAWVDGRADLGNVRLVLEHLSAVMRPIDHLFVLFIGHAVHEGDQAWLDLVGADLGSREFGRRLDEIRCATAVVAFAPCRTEAFLWEASGPNRVVVCSTRFDEDNRAGVAEAWIEGFSDARHDLDGDGRLSAFEAYVHVVEVQRGHYLEEPLAEHALLDDDGDGVGHHLGEGMGGDGALARCTFLGTPVPP